MWCFTGLVLLTVHRLRTGKARRAVGYWALCLWRGHSHWGGDGTGGPHTSAHSTFISPPP